MKKKLYVILQTELNFSKFVQFLENMSFSPKIGGVSKIDICIDHFKKLLECLEDLFSFDQSEHLTSFRLQFIFRQTFFPQLDFHQ